MTNISIKPVYTFSIPIEIGLSTGYVPFEDVCISSKSGNQSLQEHKHIECHNLNR